jgi:DNA-binding GntR family transcriptional regulator
LSLTDGNQAPSFPLLDTESLTSRARDAIRTGIISGQLTPDSLYSVKTLADGLGISRTPVREALIDLSNLGMVRFERNRGVRILEYTLQDLEEVFTLRLFLEVPATYRATERIIRSDLTQLDAELKAMKEFARTDDEAHLMEHDRLFHRIINEASGNQRLADHVDHLRDVILTRGVSTVGRSRSLHEIVREHSAILHRVRSGRPEAAASAMRAHITTTARLLIDQNGGTGAEVAAALDRMPVLGATSATPSGQAGAT